MNELYQTGATREAAYRHCTMGKNSRKRVTQNPRFQSAYIRLSYFCLLCVPLQRLKQLTFQLKLQTFPFRLKSLSCQQLLPCFIPWEFVKGLPQCALLPQIPKIILSCTTLRMSPYPAISVTWFLRLETLWGSIRLSTIEIQPVMEQFKNIYLFAKKYILGSKLVSTRVHAKCQPIYLGESMTLRF